MKCVVDVPRVPASPGGGLMRIIDLCAGSGMLAHSAAYTLADPTPNILSVDIDPVALAVCPRQAAAGITDCLDKLDWQNRLRLEPSWDGIVRP